MKKLNLLFAVLIFIIIAAGCSSQAANEQGAESIMNTENNKSTENTSSIVSESETDITPTNTAGAKLNYFGHASMSIITEDNKVIYIDPYEKGDYSHTADLILVTHDHFDHNQIDKIKNRSDDCKIITQSEALQNGEYKTFELPFVTVEAVEAGNNPNHDINSCVGYLLTFKDGKTVYISGDTSTTNQMSELSERNIDYAFFCCDGIYNMDNDEAARCAETVGAKHNIPYHNEPANGDLLDTELAESWSAPDKMIILPGETTILY